MYCFEHKTMGTWAFFLILSHYKCPQKLRLAKKSRLKYRKCREYAHVPKTNFLHCTLFENITKTISTTEEVNREVHE